jgi:hypothetical protein
MGDLPTLDPATRAPLANPEGLEVNRRGRSLRPLLERPGLRVNTSVSAPRSPIVDNRRAKTRGPLTRASGVTLDTPPASHEYRANHATTCGKNSILLANSQAGLRPGEAGLDFPEGEAG